MHIRDRAYRRWRLAQSKRIAYHVINRQRRYMELHNAIYYCRWYVQYKEKDFQELNRKFLRNDYREAFWYIQRCGSQRCSECHPHMCDWCLSNRNAKHNRKHDAMYEDFVDYVSDRVDVTVFDDNFELELLNNVSYNHVDIYHQP